VICSVPMIDHISLRVQDLAKALDFYKAALAPLGYQVLMEFPGVVGLGAGEKADLWIMETDEPTNPTHIAIGGERTHVHAFHEAAQAAGGTDNGPPGLRPDYHPNYYAGFILDPEGNNIEVVSHDPEGTESAPASKPPRQAPKKAAAQAAVKRQPKAPVKRPPLKKAPVKKASVARSVKRPAPKNLARKSAQKAAPKSAKKKPTKAVGKPRR
jgi:catechol 2,3-dioxygenase-like lactoylglutathione lyase family enzyme